MKTINPYLTFKGNCEEAFNHYKSVFGGEFTDLSRFKEMPDPDQTIPEEFGNLIMHVGLPISKETIIMGSDVMPGQFPVTQGNNYAISINTDSEEEAKRLFEGLSAGGQITMPLEKSFWGALFGMFTDKFGINWMVNYDYEQKDK